MAVLIGLDRDGQAGTMGGAEMAPPIGLDRDGQAEERSNMPRTSETPEQRRARTQKAREAMRRKFATDAERSAYYIELNRRRWAQHKQK